MRVSEAGIRIKLASYDASIGETKFMSDKETERRKAREREDSVYSFPSLVYLSPQVHVHTPGERDSWDASMSLRCTRNIKVYSPNLERML